MKTDKLKEVDKLIKEGTELNHLVTQKVKGARIKMTALMLACREGHTDIVEKLLEAGAELDTLSALIGKPWGLRFTPMSALMYACQGGHSETVDRLLDVTGIDVNYQNRDGVTALMVTCENGHIHILHKVI